MDRYCKRLIEVDLPIKRISAHARREKSIRHGHISTLHIWWARRPLAACRAVICASLWPDPADDLCPEMFRQAAREIMTGWAQNHLDKISNDSWSRFVAISKNTKRLKNLVELRVALLDFIADFSNWYNAGVLEYIEVSGLLTKAAHESFGEEPGSRPLIVDPFAGGGSIPLESLRVGANIFSSDLNPLAVLLNKVMIEYVPKYGQHLADEVRKWGEVVKKEVHAQIGHLYPEDRDGAKPIAYLWARSIICEGPKCGAQVPIIRSLWLTKKKNRSFALKLILKPRLKKVEFDILQNPKKQDVSPGTVNRGSVTCPICGFTTAISQVRKQLVEKNGGTKDARLLSVVTIKPDRKGRFYRLATMQDLKATEISKNMLTKEEMNHTGKLSFVPDEELPFMSGVFNVPLYGMDLWRHLFSPRQLLCNATLAKTVSKMKEKIGDDEFSLAVMVALSFCVSKIIDRNSSLCTWQNTGEKIGHTFGRQALGMVWDYCESNMFSGATGSWDGAVKLISKILENGVNIQDQISTAVISDAKTLPLPEDSANLFFTDPPYYNAVPYADLSDFFIVWLARCLGSEYKAFFSATISPKDQELCEMAGWDPRRYPHKDKNYFEKGMKISMMRARQVITPDGLGVVVFAHKTTEGWESLLQAMIDAGWVVTASWPLDTEFGGRLRAMGAAALASSIHLVCRPRGNQDGSKALDGVGDWRDVLTELPKRIHEWMPRLADEGVVGADAIFACLGPALEIYSRYSSVEKASGEQVELKEYLEEVWAAVSREALNMIFEGADASGFEEDARLTAMWLWTLRTAVNSGNGEDEKSAQTKSLPGYNLEYDAARKIAQGLGAHLEKLSHLVKIKGNTAMLLSAGARARYLFGKDNAEAPKKKRKKKSPQMSLFDFGKDIKQIESESSDWDSEISGKPGSTVLDQLHQSMILFAAGRGEAMKRFLVEEGIGRNPLFWRLAQALSALYPAATEEKRWVDGVLARKKGLGF